jgi:hypothetical protein
MENVATAKSGWRYVRTEVANALFDVGQQLLNKELAGTGI